MRQAKKTTIIDVAKLAGVSVSTVSVVINNKDKFVRQDLKEKILTAIRALNYSPNSIARSLKKQETKTIGLIVTNITSPVTPTMVRTIQRIGYDQGIDTIIIATEENKQVEISAVNNFVSKMLDGLIICPIESDDYQHLAYAHQQAGIPIVSIERNLPPELGIPSVSTTNFETSYQAVQHLIVHGRRRIALIAMPVFGSNTRDRINGYKRATEEKGLYDPSLVFQTDYVGSNAYTIAIDLIQNHKVDAIFAISQSIALGAYKAAMDCNQKIPNDIALIGYDSVDWMDAIPSPITRIKQPLEEIATVSANMLLQQRGNPDTVLNNVIIPSELLIKRSCGC